MIVSYFINRMPTHTLKYITPLDYFKRTFPACKINSNLPLKVFECTVFIHIPNNFQSKLNPKVKKCVCIGYAPNKKGYKCYNPHTKKSLLVQMSFYIKMNLFDKNYLQVEKNKEVLGR